MVSLSLMLAVAGASEPAWLVRLQPGVDDPPLDVGQWEKLFPPQAGSRDPKGFAATGLGRTWVVRTDDIAAIAAHPLVTFVERDGVGMGAFVPDDPWLDDQWAQRNLGSFDAAIRGRDVGAEAAWELTVGRPDVVVAVLDSGAAWGEPDLRWWTNDDEVPGNGIDDDGNGYIDDTAGWDFIDDDPTPADEHGHGNHVAATAAALGNNGIGHAGMCLDCTVMVVRNLDEDNLGFQSVWAESLVYAVDNGAWVANMSEGGPAYNQTLHDAVIYAVGAGVPVIAAAGNDNDGSAHFPSWLPETISVGATMAGDYRVDTPWWGSQYDASVDLVAPGYDVLSLGLDVGSYGYWRGGTSMATPQVTGTVALMLDLVPTLTPEEVRRFLHQGSRDLVGRPSEDTVGRDAFHGAGRLDAARTLELVLTHATPPLLRLTCTPAREGAPLTCVADGATPGATVVLVGGPQEGQGPCPAALGGECVEVLRPRVLGTRTASAAGRATWVVSATPSQGTQLALQALEGPGMRSLVWPVVVEGCGDGVIQATETCDDANTDDLDGCTSTCEATSWLPWSAAAAGGHHTCAIDALGAMRCVGRDEDGATTPLAGAYVDVAATRYSTCALDDLGMPVCWGQGTWGETTPVGGPYERIEGGWYHYCALDGAGIATCWGDDFYGQASPPGAALQSIAPGYQHSCALRTNGAPMCWGRDDDGEVSGAPAVAGTRIAAGSNHSCLIEAASGTLRCWGDDGAGQASPPAGVFTEVALGSYHSCALDDVGEAVCFGMDLPGLLQPPPGPFDAITAGRYHTCARRADDASWRCWGGNGEGAHNLSCGDGIVQRGEDCDDGARLGGDGCSEDCLAE